MPSQLEDTRVVSREAAETSIAEKPEPAEKELEKEAKPDPVAVVKEFVLSIGGDRRKLATVVIGAVVVIGLLAVLVLGRTRPKETVNTIPNVVSVTEKTPEPVASTAEEAVNATELRLAMSATAKPAPKAAAPPVVAAKKKELAPTEAGVPQVVPPQGVQPATVPPAKTVESGKDDTWQFSP
jgi:hypothetical protein